MTDFSRLIEIAQKGEKAASRTNWDLGDELNRLTPPDTPYGQVSRILAKAAAALLAEGLDFTVKTLLNIRGVAAAYPRSRRRLDLAWNLHRLAHRPDTFDALLRVHPEPTKTEVEHYMRVRKVAEERALKKERAVRRERREEARSRKEAAEKAARGAATPAVRRDAEKRAEAARREMEENAVAPTLDDVWVPEPTPEETPALLARVRWNAALLSAKQAVTALPEMFDESFTPEEIEMGVKDLFEIAEAARAFAEELRKRQGKGRFSVVA